MSEKNLEVVMTEQTKNVIINSVDLLEIKIKRDATSGLTIYLKANQPFMEQFGYPEKTHGKWTIAGVDCLYPKQEQLKNIRGYFYKDNIHEADDYPNLCLLLAKDISKGVMFNFGTIPISDHRIYEWVEKLKIQVKTIYLTYCKPVDFHVVFSTQTVEKEVHD